MDVDLQELSSSINVSGRTSEDIRRSSYGTFLSFLVIPCLLSSLDRLSANSHTSSSLSHSGYVLPTGQTGLRKSTLINTISRQRRFRLSTSPSMWRCPQRFSEQEEQCTRRSKQRWMIWDLVATIDLVQLPTLLLSAHGAIFLFWKPILVYWMEYHRLLASYGDLSHRLSLLSHNVSLQMVVPTPDCKLSSLPIVCIIN